MTNHVHCILRARDGNLPDIIHDFKRFTSSTILKTIHQIPESRRDWMIKRFEFAAKYNNFDFSMFWQGVAGNDVYNDWLQWDNFVSVTFTTGNNLGAGVLDAWFYDNTGSDKPALTWLNANEENRTSTYFMQSGSYLKLRNIELGYTLPERICAKIRMQSMRIYASAQNIISLHKWWGDDAFTGWDPEISQYTQTWIDDYDYSVNYSQNYPRPAIFSIGLNTTF